MDGRHASKQIGSYVMNRRVRRSSKQNLSLLLMLNTTDLLDSNCYQVVELLSSGRLNGSSDQGLSRDHEELLPGFLASDLRVFTCQADYSVRV